MKGRRQCPLALPTWKFQDRPRIFQKGSEIREPRQRGPTAKSVYTATRVEHLSDTLGPVGPLFSHRFRLGKHGFNRCFTRPIPGTGSSPSGIPGLWHPSCTSAEEREKGKRSGKERGRRYTWPRTTGPISPVRPNSAPARENLALLSLSLSLPWAAVYGRHYLDRAPALGLNDLFVCMRPTLSGRVFKLRAPCSRIFFNSRLW